MGKISSLTGRPAHPGGCYHCDHGKGTCICPGQAEQNKQAQQAEMVRQEMVRQEMVQQRIAYNADPNARHGVMVPEIGQHEPGAKLDNGKVDLSFLADYFPLACEEICRISEFGAKKYTRGGWRAVPEGIARYTAAMFRHLFLGYREERDSDGLLHAGCVAWNAMARLQMILEGKR